MREDVVELKDASGLNGDRLPAVRVVLAAMEVAHLEDHVRVAHNGHVDAVRGEHPVARVLVHLDLGVRIHARQLDTTTHSLLLSTDKMTDVFKPSNVHQVIRWGGGRRGSITRKGEKSSLFTREWSHHRGFRVLGFRI